MSHNKQVLVVCVARRLAQLLTLQQLVELIKTAFIIISIIIIIIIIILKSND